MTTFSAINLATWAQGRWTALPPASLSGFGTDTRTLRRGDVFVAVRTDRRDGHDFLSDARDKGASCALVSRPVADALPQLVVDDVLAGLRRIAHAWRQCFQGQVIGVTGSVGKTSTKELLAALLGADAFVTEANLNNLIGVPLMLLRVEPGRHRFAVIEAGMSVPGELAISAQVIRPDLVIVTAVTPVHLEGLGTMAVVAREKATLVEALPPAGRAILPVALLHWAEFAAQAQRCTAVQFEDEPAPAVTPARLIQATLGEDERGHRTLALDGKTFRLGALSDGLVRNAALAVVAARDLGLSDDQIAPALAAWTPPAGRGSVHVLGRQTFYLDCYNSSPASLSDAAACFDRLSSKQNGPRLFILGGMAELGNHAVQFHRESGAKLPLRAGDKVVAFGGEAPTYLQGVSRRDVTLLAVDTIDEVAQVVNSHAGYVFVKGSRSHALERCLPLSLRSALSFH